MKKKRLTCFALAMILCACTCTPAFATEQVEQGEPEEIIIPIHNNAEVREIEVSTQGITTVDGRDYRHRLPNNPERCHGLCIQQKLCIGRYLANRPI